MPRLRGFRNSAAAEHLVFCLSGNGLGPRQGGRRTVDWNGVFRLAVREHVAPLLYRRLKDGDVRSSLPEGIWERLRRAYFASGDRNARLLRELTPVLEGLAATGIRVIVLKGAYLAEAVYGDIALRPMCDCDLLVKETDLAEVESALLDTGGRRLPRHGPPATPGQDAPFHIAPILFQNLVVELHWSIVPPNGPVRPDGVGIWERARPVAVAGAEALALSTEDQLLHLCLHLCYQNACVGLRYLCDITETIQRFGLTMNWAGLAEQAREWGASRYAGLALCLARDVLGARVPCEAVQQLVPGGIDPLALEGAYQSVLTHTGHGQWLPFFEVANAPSLSDMTGLSLNRVFLSRKEMAATYPESRGARLLHPYYIRRVGHVLRTYVIHTLRRAWLMAHRPARDRDAALSEWLESGKS